MLVWTVESTKKSVLILITFQLNVILVYWGVLLTLNYVKLVSSYMAHYHVLKKAIYCLAEKQNARLFN